MQAAIAPGRLRVNAGGGACRTCDMPDIDLILGNTADPALQSTVSEGLRDYNREVCGVSDHMPLTIGIKDPESGELLGGLIGRTSLGLLFIDLFYLPKSQRGTGLGSRMLVMAEDEGRRRGCSKGVLYTISFQAPEFYKRHGWIAFGEIAANPGATRIYLTKDL